MSSYRIQALAVAVASTLFCSAAWANRIDSGSVLVIGFAPNFEALLAVGAADDGAMTIDDTPTSPFVEVVDAIALGLSSGLTGTLTVTGPGAKLICDGDPTYHNAGLSLGGAPEGGAHGVADILDGATLEIDGTESGPSDPFGAYVALAPFPDSTATMTVDASTVTILNGAGPLPTLAVGIASDATMTISGGSTVSLDTGTGVGGGISMGGVSPDAADISGVLTVTGTGSQLIALGESNSFAPGVYGIGTLDVLDGGALVGQRMILGLNPGSQGFSEVSGGSSIDLSGIDEGFGGAAGINVGLGGTGELVVQDGTIVIDSIEGGDFPGITVGGSGGPNGGGEGRMWVSGADASIDLVGPFHGVAVGLDGPGTLDVLGGARFSVENPQSSSGMSIGLLAAGEGVVHVAGAGSRLEMGENILAGVDLLLADTGRAVLEVGEGAAVRADFVYLGTQATLRGTGTVESDVVNLRGTTAPGASPGELTVSGAFTQAGGATRIQAAGAVAPAVSRIAANLVAFEGGAIAFDLLAGYLPAQGDELTFAATSGGASIDPNTVVDVVGAAPGFLFEVAPANANNDLVLRALNDAEGLGACQVAQLKAASTLCKKHFLCGSKYAKKPSKDQDEAKRDGCEQKALEKFGKAYDKAVDRAAKKGDACGLSEPAVALAGAVTAGADAIIGGILEGWDPDAGDPDDDKLRGALLKEAGTLCGKLAAAASKNLKKPNEDKRLSALEKARGVFGTKTDKALQKAADKGVSYDGADAANVRDETDQLAAETAGATGGV